MAVIASVGVDDAERATCDPVDELAFSCKCGCDLFRMHAAVYANGDWTQKMTCAACEAVNVMTEPVMNGPH